MAFTFDGEPTSNQQALSDRPIIGRKLNRDEALGHPWLNAFWEVMDWLILNDPTLHEHVYHTPLAARRRRSLSP
jgi:hypothetical protein